MPFESDEDVNYSLSFDGVDDYIKMQNFQVPDPYLYDATIELWFKSNVDPLSFSEDGFQKIPFIEEKWFVRRNGFNTR